MVVIWSPSFMGRAARRLGEDADPKWVIGVHLPRNIVQCILNDVHMSRSSFRNSKMNKRVSRQARANAPPNKPAQTASSAPATDGRSPSLWFGAPIDDQDRRRPQLT